MHKYAKNQKKVLAIRFRVCYHTIRPSETDTTNPETSDTTKSRRINAVVCTLTSAESDKHQREQNAPRVHAFTSPEQDETDLKSA